MNTATNAVSAPAMSPASASRRFEEEGDFYIGCAANGSRTVRLLCFRNRITRAVGASARFSRKEAWRRSRKCLRQGKAGS